MKSTNNETIKANTERAALTHEGKVAFKGEPNAKGFTVKEG